MKLCSWLLVDLEFLEDYFIIMKRSSFLLKKYVNLQSTLSDNPIAIPCFSDYIVLGFFPILALNLLFVDLKSCVLEIPCFYFALHMVGAHKLFVE